MRREHQAPVQKHVRAERFPNERLKGHRLKKNWTQVYVATMIGTSDVEVSRWETGAAEPSLYFREKLCKLFGAIPEELGFVSSSDETGPVEVAQHPSQRRAPLTSLLATKLYVPRLRTQLVQRSHLIERLQQGMLGALTLVSAPAGFGKTTLLAQWLAEMCMPVAWLSLEPEDNDATRFLSYLIAALQTLEPGIGMTALALLESPQPPLVEAVLTVLTNELVSRAGEEFALVLDDYHVITAESIHQGMSFLLEHLPPHMHLILATRADPPLPLARLRAQGRLCELRTAELRFGDSEVRAFLEMVMGLHLPPEAIATLESRTEGWIAGLQLAALSLQGRADVTAFLAAFSGSHRYVLDYLSDEVLARQNLFVVALDDERGWYRYHHLFAQVLHGHLLQAEPTLPPVLHRRASAWYEQHDLPIEAVQHALVAPDVELAARLIEPIAFLVAFQGQLYTVLRWIKALPEALVRTRPLLCVYHARLLTFTNQLESAEARLEGAEEGIQKEESASLAPIIIGWVLDTRAGIFLFSGDIPQAVSLAHQALALLPESEVIPRASALTTTTRAYLVSGDVTPASEHAVAAAVALIRTSDNPFAAVSSICLLARLHILQGRLRQAAATYARVVQVIPRPEVLQTTPSSLFYYFGLGDLLREWNELDVAKRHLAQGMALVNETLTVEPTAAMLGYTALARLQQAQGNTTAALATLDALARLAQQRHFAPHLMTLEAAVRAQLELAQGNMAAAIHWADTSGLSAQDEDLRYPHEGEYLTLARVRIAQAHDNLASPFLQDVLRLLDRLLWDAEAKARLCSVLEILVLRVLALEAQGDRTSALSTLERALVLAAPEGYIRLFVDEGASMQALLRHARGRSAVPRHARGRSAVPWYVATLLSAFGEQNVSDLPLPAARPSALLEPLTEREREVLRLLLEGASNREIAHRLVLSVNTVKRHVYNICGKLGVQNRSQAIIRARDLNLL